MESREKSINELFSGCNFKSRYLRIRKIYDKIFADFIREGNTEFRAHSETEKILSDKFGKKRVKAALSRIN